MYEKAQHGTRVTPCRCLVIAVAVGKSVPHAMAEVEETLRRINTHKGVSGILILSPEGEVMRGTLPTQAEATKWANLILPMTKKARSEVRNLDPMNDLTFIRVRSKKHEILIAPDEVRSAVD
jgi:dynein light chain roadblock-type